MLTATLLGADEEKVLEQVIKDTEEATVDDEVGVDLEEEGSGSGAEPGASALLDEFIMRCVHVMLHYHLKPSLVPTL